MQAYNASQESWLATDLSVARSFIKRVFGLLGKAGLAPAQGLWIKPCDSIHTLGMRFTIDAVFLDHQGRVVKVIKQLRPFRLVFPVAGAASVIELPVGSIVRTGTRVGDKILITNSDYATPISEAGRLEPTGVATTSAGIQRREREEPRGSNKEDQAPNALAAKRRFDLRSLSFDSRCDPPRFAIGGML